MAGRKRKNNAEYFSHDAGMRNDEKVKALRNKFGVNGYAFWNMFLEVLCGREGFIFERTEISIMLLSGDIGFDETEINDMLDYLIKLKLIFADGENLFSQHLIDRLEPLLAKRIKMREVYQKVISDKKKAVSEAEMNNSDTESPNSDNYCGSQTSEIPQRKGKIKESKVKNKKNILLEKLKEERIQIEQYLQVYPEHKLEKDAIEVIKHLRVTKNPNSTLKPEKYEINILIKNWLLSDDYPKEILMKLINGAGSVEFEKDLLQVNYILKPEHRAKLLQLEESIISSRNPNRIETENEKEWGFPSQHGEIAL